MKRFAFTLSEVMVTLVVIGIVASMTLPSLIHNQQKRTYELAIKKVYVDMSQAVKLHLAQYGKNKVTRSPFLYSEVADGSDLLAKEFLFKYFKVAKDCGSADTDQDNVIKKCFGDKYTSLDGVKSAPNPFGYCVSLSSGATVCLDPGDGGVPAVVYVDTNGKKKPNIAGYDLFTFNIYYNEQIGENHDGDICISMSNSAYGYGCFSRLLENGFKMDY